MSLENRRISLLAPKMSNEGYELNFIKEAYETNALACDGPNVPAFEREFASFFGVNAALALCSGTAALHLALISAGVGEGDIVLCPALAFSSTANPILYQRATPVFIDSDLSTWNMSHVALRRALKKYPEAKAVIVVHIYGLAANVETIVDLCKEHKVTLIEDAAESLGTKYNDRYTGTFGDYGSYSFHDSKPICCGSGGMLVCNRSDAEQNMKRARLLSSQARYKEPEYENTELGYNYQIGNLTAGIGRGQLKVMERHLAKKQYIYDFYCRELGGLDKLEMMPIHDWETCNCWLTCIQLYGSVRPAHVQQALAASDIESRGMWRPLPSQKLYAQYDYIDNYQTARHLFDNGLCLPSDVNMTDADLRRVCDIIKTLW